MTSKEYNTCVDLYADNIFRFILKQTNSEDRSKDIVQDTFEKLWVKAENVSFEKAKSYLFTAAYHTMIDLIRKEKRMTNFEGIHEDLYSSNQASPDLKELLDEALNRLPEIQKTVILLRDYEGYSYSEIGKITNLNEQQVKVYIYRGRLALKKFIGRVEILI